MLTRARLSWLEQAIEQLKHEQNDNKQEDR
jgi:hypothetical protein